MLYASQGQYDKARAALEMAIRTHPSYATAHENLGDIYAKMASQAYDKALQLDKSNTTAQTKLNLIKDLFPAGKPGRTAAKGGAHEGAADPPDNQAGAGSATPPAPPSRRRPRPPVVTFDQAYASSNLENRMRKRLYWIREGGAWRIIHEGAA